MNGLPIVYLVSAIVLIISSGLVVLPGVPEFVKNVMTLPIVGAIGTALYETWKERRAHERALELQNKEQDFTLGIASHMAEVVFDKQAAFYEEYAKIIVEVTSHLMAGQAIIEGRNSSIKLVNLRRANIPWLHPDANVKLGKFEDALFAAIGNAEAARIMESPLERQVLLDAHFERVAAILGWNNNRGTTNLTPAQREEMLADGVVDFIRSILQTEQIENLRKEAISMASQRAKNRN